jgi:small redox-active disulfide protein 2
LSSWGGCSILWEKSYEFGFEPIHRRRIRDEAAQKTDEKPNDAHVACMKSAEPFAGLKRSGRAGCSPTLSENRFVEPGVRMKNIKVLGSGCANCKTTLRLIEDVAKTRGVDVSLEKIEDMAAILGFGVMSTPGVVIDGTVVHAGGVPDRKKVESWF